MKTVKILRERHYKFYDIRDEEWDPEIEDDSETHVMKKQAYSKNGDYIGSSVEAYRRVHRLGITQFEKASSEHCVCSIGFAPESQKWYGWSHRAICGFAIGDVVKEGDCVTQSGWTDDYLAEHPDGDMTLPIGFTAQNLEDAKRMALSFSESVS